MNGWHHGSQLFECAEGKAVFLPFTHFQPDRRFEQSIPHFASPSIISNGAIGNEVSLGFHNTPTAPSCINDSKEENDIEFGGIECPTVPGFEQPIQDYVPLLGRNRGIQGHQNSCYLDATLFAMFSFTR